MTRHNSVTLLSFCICITLWLCIWLCCSECREWKVGTGSCRSYRRPSFSKCPGRRGGRNGGQPLRHSCGQLSLQHGYPRVGRVGRRTTSNAGASASLSHHRRLHRDRRADLQGVQPSHLSRLSLHHTSHCVILVTRVTLSHLSFCHTCYACHFAMPVTLLLILCDRVTCRSCHSVTPVNVKLPTHSHMSITPVSLSRLSLHHNCRSVVLVALATLPCLSLHHTAILSHLSFLLHLLHLSHSLCNAFCHSLSFIIICPL